MSVKLATVPATGMHVYAITIDLPNFDNGIPERISLHV
jgi:hypothetical protein